MVRHSPLSAAATAGSNSSLSNMASSASSSSSSSVKPVQHQLDRASAHFEGFIVDLMDRITNVRQLFTVRLHLMQRTVLRRQFCPSVHLSVCLSFKRAACDKTKKCAHILIPHERWFILVVFCQEVWLVGRDDLFYLKFCAKLT